MEVAAILITILGVLVFFIPAIYQKATDTHYKSLGGRSYTYAKNDPFRDSSQGNALKGYALSMMSKGIDPHSKYGLDLLQGLFTNYGIKYSHEEIKDFLIRLGIKENDTRIAR